MLILACRILFVRIYYLKKFGVFSQKKIVQSNVLVVLFFMVKIIT